MLVYLAIVVVFCAIYPIVPRKHIKWLFLALVLALSIMAFYMKPYETDDIGNYFNQVSMLRKGGFSTLRRCIQNGDNHWDSLPVCGFYFYLISLFPDNGMLPAVTIFLAYGSMFWVLWRASQRYNEVNKWYLFVASFFILSTYWFYDICSGIRNGLTFTLFCLFAYVELVELNFLLSCLLYPIWIYREAAGIYLKTKYIMTATAVLNIGLSILMGKWIGMAGIIFASAVSKLLTYIWYEPIILFRDHFKKSVWGYFVSFFATLVISCGAGFGVKLLADMIPLSGILGFIVKGIVCFAATNILYLILYFKNPYFKELLARVKSLVDGVIGKFKKAK